MKNRILLIALLLSSISLSAHEYDYKFRLILKDKGKTQYSIEKPQEFLSEKSIERRKKQGITISMSDLPISKDYIESIEQTGAIVVAKSKWLNSVSVHCSDSSIVNQLKELSFVLDARVVWKGKRQDIKIKEYPDTLFLPNKQEILFGNHYGRGYDNIKTLKTDVLHKAGFKGEGIDIAVIDAGFNYLPSIELLDNLNIKGHKGFVYGNENLFINANQHGLNVVSCIGTNKPMQFVGAAPEAGLWLLGTEDSRSEFPIEEDYWAAAIEYADSVGVDVVNTSLGYNNFDAPTKGFTHKDLDGKTAHISRAANMAANKGMLVVVSAGNSGDSAWRKITPPSDAEYVLTVGAIARDSSLTRFSSRGPTADLRIKPDVLALGSASIVVDQTGLIAYKSGTSFSSPIMCGTVACLWQANPTLTNKELIQIIKKSSDKFSNPDGDYGYGIPNMEIAMELAKKFAKTKGKNKIGISDNFRIESDGVGQIRIIAIRDEPMVETYEFTIKQKMRTREKEVSHFFHKKKDTYEAFEEYYQNLKAKEKALYTLTIKGPGIDDIFNLYF